MGSSAITSATPARGCQRFSAGHSAGTAAARREEGGDDVKSARPLRPGRHTCYNGGHRGMPPREGARIPKPRPSSDWSLQPGSTKLDSLVIAHQPWRGEYVPGPCVRLEHLLSGSPRGGGVTLPCVVVLSFGSGEISRWNPGRGMGGCLQRVP